LNENELNNLAFSFVEKIQILEDDEKKPKLRKTKGSVDHLSVIDMTDKLITSPIIRTQFNPEISDTTISISIESNRYGFKLLDYVEYYRFIHQISQFNGLHDKVSTKYLRKQVLLWIIDVYRKQRADKNLINYLLDEFHNEIRKTKYYYPILNISIEEPFKIGNIEIKYFTKEYFDDYWDYRKKEGDTDKDIFNKTFRKYQGRVFIVVETYAEDEKGQDISYNLATLVADILKLLSPTIYHPQDVCLIDLEKRMPFYSEYLSMDSDKEFNLKMSISANHSQFHISKEMFSSIEKNMIEQFGKTLGNKIDFEITYLVIDSIRFIAKSISEPDLHLRISLLIMVIESIFLLDDEDYKMEKKCKRRMTDLLYPNNGKKKQKLFEALTEMYKIRHKMTHKSIREYIELQLLREFQTNIIEVILVLLGNDKKIDNKENLILMLDSRIKNDA